MNFITILVFLISLIKKMKHEKFDEYTNLFKNTNKFKLCSFYIK